MFWTCLRDSSLSPSSCARRHLLYSSWVSTVGTTIRPAVVSARGAMGLEGSRYEVYLRFDPWGLVFSRDMVVSRHTRLPRWVREPQHLVMKRPESGIEKGQRMTGGGE
jgi:hypothetical protein